MHHTRNISARALFAASAIALASIASAGPQATTDNVLSANIKEADGTTGQDTNSGSGVKTGHIQDGAVTAPKLAPAAVGTPAIADGAVTGAKVAPAAIGTSAIADGAVTDAKITGPISGSKISWDGYDADLLDGFHASAFQRKYAKVAVVALDGTGDYTDPNQAAWYAASWCGGQPSETHPCLVKVMPGFYDLGAGGLSMRPHVDVEGSGEGTTIISSSHWTAVVAASDAELRSLTIENTRGAGYGGTATGVDIRDASFRLRNVTIGVGGATQVGNYGVWVSTVPGHTVMLDDVNVNVSGSVGENIGIEVRTLGSLRIRGGALTATGGTDAYALSVSSAADAPLLTVRSTTIDVSGASRYNVGVDVTGLTNVRLVDADVTVLPGGQSVNAAVSNWGYWDAGGGQWRGPTVRVDRSDLVAPTALYTYQATSFIANSRMAGSLTTPSGTLPKCIAVYDESYDAMGAAQGCQGP